MSYSKIPFSLALCLPIINAFCADSNPSEKAILQDISHTMKIFTQHPHPMGSPRQLSLSKTLASTWKKRGLKVERQLFSARTPNTQHLLLGGKDVQKKWIKKTGVNVVGTRPGSHPCAIILGGHYDTKFYRGFRFVGANDGGSSTALLMALPLLLQKKQAKKSFSLSQCDLHLVLFDGEEAQLPNWETGQKVFGKRDNLYGSSKFVKDNLKKKNGKLLLNGKPLYLTVILDMVGHKKQRLNITMGSHAKSEALLKKVSTGIDYAHKRPPIEDDHLPFMQAGSKVLHIIDWNNLKEWHTPKDTLAIISNEKIYRLTLAISRFLQEPVKETYYKD